MTDVGEDGGTSVAVLECGHRVWVWRWPTVTRTMCRPCNDAYRGIVGWEPADLTTSGSTSGGTE